MGWMFKNSTSDKKYDGIKVRFLYSYDHIHDSRTDPDRSSLLKGYTDYFELDDMYSNRLNIEKQEPKDMKVDKDQNWRLERSRSKKVCLNRGDCVFIAGFSRAYRTSDKNGEDILIELGSGETYESYGFFAQYLTEEFRLESNTVVETTKYDKKKKKDVPLDDYNRYNITTEDILINIEP